MPSAGIKHHFLSDPTWPTPPAPPPAIEAGFLALLEPQQRTVYIPQIAQSKAMVPRQVESIAYIEYRNRAVEIEVSNRTATIEPQTRVALVEDD